MTGELFDAVAQHTILSHAVAGADAAQDIDAFKSAVMAAFETPALAANLLFQVRSGQLLYGGEPAAARDRISGTLIGLEMAAGLAESHQVRHHSDRIGPAADALPTGIRNGAVPVRSIEADAAVRRGLSAAQAIWRILR